MDLITCANTHTHTHTHTQNNAAVALGIHTVYTLESPLFFPVTQYITESGGDEEY